MQKQVGGRRGGAGGGGVRWVGEQQRFPPSSLPWPFAFWLPQMFFSAPWSQQVMGSEQGGLGRAAAGLGALEPSPPHPPQPLLLPTAVWGSPALAKAGSAPSHGDMLPMGSRDAVGFGGCIHPDAGCPPSSATGSGTAVPSCPPCHQPCSSPHGSNPPPPPALPPTHLS